MARREGGGNGIMGVLGGLVLGIIVIICYFAIVPVIGSSMETAMPALPADSQWNATTNPDLPSASGLWVTSSGLIIIAIVIAILGVVVGVVKMMGWM
jgi:uncharacterized membrane protein YraQ (UPF0718 family)